jgi:hypothetical protein
MTKSIEADAILTAAEPLVHQYAPEIQPYGHVIRMPIALPEDACKESVENLISCWLTRSRCATVQEAPLAGRGTNLLSQKTHNTFPHRY